MKVKALVVSILAAFGLTGCDQLDLLGRRAGASHNVSTPALPLIQEAVSSLSPTFNGRRVPVLVNELCALARNQITQQQADAQLAGLGLPPASLPRTGTDALALLVNGDRAGQATACAAYQAVAAVTPVNLQEVLRQVPDRSASHDNAAHHGAGDKATKAEAEVAKAPRWEVDLAVLNKLLPLRIAQARANAEAFAYIAEQLAATPGLSTDQYRAKARELFSGLAPHYLDKVQQYLPATGTKYELKSLKEGELGFSSDGGVQYLVSASKGLVFAQNGQLWYGKGLLMGRDYRVQVAYLK